MNDTSETDRRTDLRTTFPHASWQDVYTLLDCETSIEAVPTPEGRL